MKKVLILFGSSNWENQKFFSDEKYQKAYECLYGMAENKGIEMYRASYDWYDEENKIFKYAHALENGEWKRKNDIKPDIVYDKAKSCVRAYCKKSLINESFPIINNPEFTHFVNNKLLSSLLFPAYFKEYKKIETKQELVTAVKDTEGSKIVLKPIKGSGGEGVEIINVNDVDGFAIDEPLIAQEFVDSSAGIEGITDGTHDLRLVFINNELIYSYIRTPAEGSLLANVAKGGSMKIVEKNELPDSVIPIIRDFQEKFSFYKTKVYTIDMIFDENQHPWVIEFNTMPGIYFSPGQEKWREKFFSALIEMFKNEIDRGIKVPG